LSYLLSYHFLMAQRQKRSISLPSDLADAIDQAATAEGTTVSAWIAETAAHRLRLDAGRQGEIADGLARARAMLRRQPARKSA
jgi:predicted transcriptional regulator